MFGTVKRKNEKGFGFITPEEQDQNGQETKDVFFHSSALVDMTFEELPEGARVSYDTESSDKGPRATNVRRA